MKQPPRLSPPDAARKIGIVSLTVEVADLRQLPNVWRTGNW